MPAHCPSLGKKAGNTALPTLPCCSPVAGGLELASLTGLLDCSHGPLAIGVGESGDTGQGVPLDILPRLLPWKRWVLSQGRPAGAQGHSAHREELDTQLQLPHFTPIMVDFNILPHFGNRRLTKVQLSPTQIVSRCTCVKTEPQETN